MAAILPAGMRAISTPIREETAAGGFILPNDRVDVILSHKLRVGSKEESVSEAVLRNVRVLAIGQEIENKDGEKVATGKTATLELSPSQAETLALAQSMGELSLSLRSLAGLDPRPCRDDGQDRRQQFELGQDSKIRRALAQSSASTEAAHRPDNEKRQTDASLLTQVPSWPRGICRLAHSAWRHAPSPAWADQQHRSYLRIADTGGQSQQIELGLNKSMIVELPRDAREVMVSNPEQVEAVLQTSRRAYLIGKAAGRPTSSSSTRKAGRWPSSR